MRFEFYSIICIGYRLRCSAYIVHSASPTRVSRARAVTPSGCIVLLFHLIKVELFFLLMYFLFRLLVSLIPCPPRVREFLNLQQLYKKIILTF